MTTVTSRALFFLFGQIFIFGLFLLEQQSTQGAGFFISQALADELPSWKPGATKKTILDFVQKVTDKDSSAHKSPDERIVVFDNDGTLWAEKPFYFQLYFALDRVKELAPKHPEWKSKEPFASILKGDSAAALKGGEEALMEIIMETHAGMTTEEFSSAVENWIEKARHPMTKKPFTEMIYQPMLELLTFLRSHGFKTYIVSGGGIDFMRPWTEKVYGIPPEQVVGSSIELLFEMSQDKPSIKRLPKLNFLDDKAGKPVGIHRHIGRIPLAAFGNSDGDLQMLQWTTAGEGVRLAGIVHHTDAKREWAYDRASSVGHLDKALDEAKKEGWLVIDMQKDWSQIFPFETRH